MKQRIIIIPPRHMKVGWLKRLAEQIEEDKEKENKNMEEAKTKFNFSKALELLKEGKRVAREGWNGKGLFVYMVAGGDYKVQMDSVKHLADENNCLHYEPYLAIKNIKGTINTWVPSISDLMAEDWVLA